MLSAGFRRRTSPPSGRDLPNRTPTPGTGKLRKMLRRAGSMPWQRKPWTIFARAAAPADETSGQSRILALLSGTSRRHPAVGGRILPAKNPRHPSLNFKRIGGFWSVRVGLHYRALAVQAEAEVVWFWIGPPAEYGGIIGAS